MNHPFSMGDSFTKEGVSERTYTRYITHNTYSVHLQNLSSGGAEGVRSSLHGLHRRERVSDDQLNTLLSTRP